MGSAERRVLITEPCQTVEVISSFDSHNVDVTSEYLEAVGSKTSQSRYLRYLSSQ